MQKLSLDALKERAEEVQTSELMEKIEGGTGLTDCHGFWGFIGKVIKQQDDANRPGYLN